MEAVFGATQAAGIAESQLVPQAGMAGARQAVFFYIIGCIAPMGFGELRARASSGNPLFGHILSALFARAVVLGRDF